MNVRRKLADQVNPALNGIDVAGFRTLATLSSEFLESEYKTTITSLATQLQFYQTAFDKILQGVCFFDNQQRLVLSNRRYAEIYHLQPEDVKPGMTFYQIMECRFKTASSPAMNMEKYISLSNEIINCKNQMTLTVTLRDGRSIFLSHLPMQDGGWVATHDDITERRNKNISIQTLIDAVPDYLWVKDIEGRFVIVNKALATDCGRAETSELIGLSDFDIHPPECAGAFFACEQDIIQSGQPMLARDEFVFDGKGAKKTISTRKIPLRNDDGEIFGLVGICHDITKSNQAGALRNGQSHVLEMIAMNAPLKEVLDYLVHLIEAQMDGMSGSILVLGNNGLHLQHVAGPSLPDVFKKALDGIHIGPDAGSCATGASRGGAMIVSGVASHPLWDKHRELAAQHGFGSCWSMPIISHQGGLVGALGMYSTSVREQDVAAAHLLNEISRIAGIAVERQQAADRIEFMVHHDALTGLPNRILLKDRLAQAISFAQRYERWISVVFINLDNFKTVNDSLGQNVGDELLKTIAGRLTDCMRSTDTVVRFAGDEFVVILFDQPKNADIVIQTLQKIRATIAEPVNLVGHNLHVTSSIGLANYPDDGMDADTLLANANAAMCRAKDSGRDNFQFYTADLNTSAHAKFLLQAELRNALDRSEFVLHYQPQVDLRSGQMFAVEALIRWNHPSMGFVSPMKFIPLAEETGLIVPIGDWVLLAACRQNKAWQDAGLPPMTVCVNVSARQFKEKNWVSRVVYALQESGLAANYLELELTESLIMQDVEQAVVTMKELKDLGIQLAIDDFGTGYSSLSALKNFPVTRLKIDKSFVNEIPNNANDNAVISAVISLGHNLNMKIIAEGVENADQIEFLRAQKCDEMQGYYFSKPISARDIGTLLGGNPKTLDSLMGRTNF